MEIVGAKDLRSGHSWSAISPVCQIRMGQIEERTSPVDADKEPLWGQEFFFDFNPLGTLHIALTNEQFLVSEELGRIEITVTSILDGLQRAEGQAISISRFVPCM